ncbi:hypothetical protein D3C79_576010 [compost metagenome]
MHHDGGDDGGGPHHGDGGGADGGVQHYGHQPGQQYGVHVQLGEDGGEAVPQATGLEHAVEGAAGPDDQQYVGDGGEALLGLVQQPFHLHALADPQHVVGGEGGDEHGGDGVADKLQHGIEVACVIHVELGHRLGQHQQYGQQHGEEGGAEGGELGLIARLYIRKGGGHALERHPLAQQLQEQGAADQGGKEPDREAIDDDGSDIGSQLIGDIERGRMGRHYAVHGHQGGAERDGERQQRGVGLAGDGEGERDQQHHPHLDEQGDAAHQADQHHDDLRREPAALLQGETDALGGARYLHHLAEYGAKADDGGEEAQGAAYALFHGIDHLDRVHPHHGADIEARQQQGEEGVDPALHYGEDDQDDASQQGTDDPHFRIHTAPRQG